MSADLPFYAPNFPSPPARVRQPGERLFSFLRGSDRALMTCELRFHGESYGWEVQFFGHGAFVLRAQAVQWAEEERAAMETEPRGPGRVA